MNTPSNFDVVVIGSGPGGYVAAIRCAQLGLRTACVERWRNINGKLELGGTCLNVGCIPSKALLDSSHHYHQLLHGGLAAHGIEVDGARFDVAAMQTRKYKVVQTLQRGVGTLLERAGVEVMDGVAQLLPGDGADEVRVEVVSEMGGGGGRRVLRPAHIIVATGSVPAALDVAPVDINRIVDSTGALAFAEAPPRLGIIGAGAIGLELGSVWNRLGSKVVLLEALPDFLAGADRDIARDAQRVFKRQGLDIRLGQRVTGCETTDNAVTVRFESGSGDDAKADQIEVDKLVVAVGRRPATVDLGLEAVGIECDERGFIPVDGNGRTARPNVWAIGDCTPGPMLAHRASEDGVAVAERIAGQSTGASDHRLVPWVIYTHPEIAWVGRTEAELDAAGIRWRAGKFPFGASGRALAAGDTDGFAKVIADASSDEILGVHVLGAQASELVAEAVTAMEFRASAEDIARTIHAHPTRSEVLHEAALAVDGRAIHM